MAAKLIQGTPEEVAAHAADFLPGHAIVSNETLNDLIETAEENNSPIALEIEKYAMLGVPVLVPISTLARWQRAALIASNCDE